MTKEKLTTPEGYALYPKLNTPDEYKGQKKYKVTLLLKNDSVEWAELKETITKLVDDSYADAIETGVIPAKHRDTTTKIFPFSDYYKGDEKTDFIEIKFNMKSEFMKDGELIKLQPKIFDSQANVIPNNTFIKNGSIIKVQYSPYKYYNPAQNICGVSLKLSAVQVIQLKDPDQQYSTGFDKVDGGYVKDYNA